MRRKYWAVFVIFKIFPFKIPHTRSDNSQQIVPAFPDPKRLVSKRDQKPKTPSTPNPTFSAPRNSSHNPLFEDIYEEISFLEQYSPSTPIHFQEPKLEEHSFESVSFTFTQAQPNILDGSSTIIHQPTPIPVLPPPSFTFTTGSSTSTTQGAINQVVNMAAPTFLMDRYAPLNLAQPMNAMPQEYLKLLPRFTRED